jgi:NodT family efflux transporter outer membrane factor (OMF) lipoprotein
MKIQSPRVEPLMDTSSRSNKHSPVQPTVLASLLLSLSLSGCMVGPDYQAPEHPHVQSYVPQGTSTTANAGDSEVEQHVAIGAQTPPSWWTDLQYPELNQTVAMALAHNWTLDAARANLAKAKENIKVQRAGLLPQVDGGAYAERTKYGAAFLGPLASTFPTFSAYSGGLNVSYDLDVFGGQKRRIESALAQNQVQEEALHAAHLTVAGETVLTALQIASVREQIRVMNEVIASDERNLTLVKAARDAGVASVMDVTTAQSQLDSDRAKLPPLQQQWNVAQDTLAILVGKTPAEWKAPDFELEKFALPPNVPVVVPSDLVRARPDIRAAEAALHAASAEIGVATADMYPHIALNAGIAGQGLFSGGASTAWSVLGGISGPIFHGGALSARRRAAQDDYQVSFAQYQQTVLASFKQVADNLYGLDNAANEVRDQQKALNSANYALNLTRQGYAVGNAGIVQVLDAQRLQQLALLQLVQARTTRYVDTVGLYLATGGGIVNDTAAAEGASHGSAGMFEAQAQSVHRNAAE